MIKYKKYPNVAKLINNIELGDIFVWRIKNKNTSFYWIIKKQKYEVLLFHLDLETKKNDMFWYNLHFIDHNDGIEKFLKITNRF